MLKHKLTRNAVEWSVNLSPRCEPFSLCVQVDDITSVSLTGVNGVPQGSVLGPILFILYISDIYSNVIDTDFHMQVDDTVMYSSRSTSDMALVNLYLAFNIVQSNFCDSKLVTINSEKKKPQSLCCLQNRKPKSLHNLFTIITFHDSQTELVDRYKWLGVFLFLILLCLVYLLRLIRGMLLLHLCLFLTTVM